MRSPTLTRRAEFDLVYSQGRRQACQALVLLHLENTPYARVAFVASRKVGGAVARNRAKRLMREAFRQVEAGLPMPKGWLVLIARRDILQLKSDQVAARLRGLVAAILGANEISQVRPPA